MVSCYVLLNFNKQWTSWCILPAPPPPPGGTGYPSCGFALWNRISLCFCGIPSPTAAVLCIPSPPLWNRMVFPFVNVWPFYLPTPLLWKRMGFPFALRHIYTHPHTHTPRVCVCMAFSLRTCSPAKPPFHSFPPLHPFMVSVMYSCISISNGCHGVFSPPPPPPLWNRISLLRFCPVEQDIPLLLRYPLPPHRAGL